MVLAVITQLGVFQGLPYNERARVYIRQEKLELLSNQNLGLQCDVRHDSNE